MKHKQLKRWSPLIVLAGILLLWQAFVSSLSIPDYIFPGPWQIAGEFMEFKGPLLQAAWKTCWVTMLGFGLSIAVGGLLVFLIGSSRLAYTALFPLMVAFNAVPKAAIVPILVVWFGIGLGPGILTAFLISFFPITVNIATGLATLEPQLEDVLRVLGAKRWDVLVKVGLPRSMPYFYGSLKVAITLAFVGTVLAEMTTGDSGIGYLMQTAGLAAALAFGFRRPGGHRRNGHGHVRVVFNGGNTHHRLGASRLASGLRACGGALQCRCLCKELYRAGPSRGAGVNLCAWKRAPGDQPGRASARANLHRSLHMKPQAPAQRKPNPVSGPWALLTLGCTLATTAWAQSAPAPDTPGGVTPVLQAPVVGVLPVAVPAAAAAPIASPASPSMVAPGAMPGAAALAPPLPASAPTITTARVLSVTSVAQAAAATRVVCAEPAEVSTPTTGAGAVAGALVGAAVGGQVGGGSGNALATAAGLVGGALLGDKAEQAGRTQTVRTCVTHSGPSPALAYQVLYELGGQQYSTVLPYHPGASLQVQLTPVAGVAGASGEPVPAAQTVIAHTVVAAPPYPYSYGPYGYHGPYWRVPVVVGVGAVWGRPYRGWHGRRW